MIPLVDLHCHLLAGLDDGPKTEADAVEMCRIAHEDGIRAIAALAHQNETWKQVTPEAIRLACRRLAENLAGSGIALSVLPTAEVMVDAQTEAAWDSGRLLSVADRRQYLLIEMPHGLTLDIRRLVANFIRRGIRPILAHPERCAPLLHQPGVIEELVAAGCLVQVSAHSVTDPPTSEDRRAIKDWFRRGVVHVMGSDGHTPRRRAPRLAAAYRVVAKWAGSQVADRTFSTHGTAILHGLPLRVQQPDRRPVGWWSRLWT